MFKKLCVLGLMSVAVSCTSPEEIPVDCEDETNVKCSSDTSQFSSGGMGSGKVAGAAGGALLLGAASSGANSKSSNDSATDISSNKSLIPINRKIMRHDGEDQGLVLLVESTNIYGTYLPGSVVQATINWQFPHSENTDTVYLGRIFGDWECEFPGGWICDKSLTDIDVRFPVIGETRTERFNFTAPEEPGIYLLRMILNSSTTYPENWGDLQHYRYDFIFEVRGHDDLSPDDAIWYIGRGDGARVWNEEDVGSHVLALKSENIIDKTYGLGEKVTADFTWGFPYGENRNAIFSCNAFGSWDHENQIEAFYLGKPMPKDELESDVFSFTAPSSPGVYSLRLIFNSAFDYATSFTGATHYFADLVFNVADTDLPLGDLQLYYPFNGNANDESGSEVHPSLLEATLDFDRKGNPNSAYSFVGVDHVNYQFIYFDMDDVIGGMDSFTMSVWFKASEITSESSVLTSLTDDFGQFSLGPNSRVNDKISFRVNIGEGDYTNIEIVSDDPVINNQWYHVAVVYDGNSLRMYVNNELQENSELISGAITLNTTPTGLALWIGAEHRNQTNFNSPEGYTGFTGSIDDIRLYSRALSASEVSLLYDE
ncbi:MAG: LamG domain-containing protein [SAR324 cluster bacterium]|nr:LamG domain-containing protein [SAR324 cluster bacterium]